MSGSIEYWVQVMRDEYLPSATYEGDDTISLVEERAIDSLLSELRDALRSAEQEWWGEVCTHCNGSCGDDKGDTCSHCEGTGLEHNER